MGKFPFPVFTDFVKMKQKEIDPDIVIKMFDHLKGRMSSYGKSKWVTKPSENLK